MNVLTASGMKASKLLNEQGGLNIVTRWDKLNDDIRVLLMTSKGTLIGDPNFGSNLFTMIYQPASNIQANMMRTEIQNCIEDYYPELTVTQIDISYLPHGVNFEVYYKIVNTNTLNKVSLLFIKSGAYIG